MDIFLPPDLEEYIREKLKHGFASPSDVIQEALRVHQDYDRMRQLKIEQLRKEIQVGIDAADGGDMQNADEVFASVRERLEALE